MRGKLNRVSRYLRLIRRHHRILWIAFRVLLIVRIRLTFRSYHDVVRWSERHARPLNFPIQLPVLVWSITHCSRLIPRASCLTQALALRFIMMRMGEDCVVRIGVRTTKARPFDAHAWVIHRDRVLIGGNEEDLQTFTRLVDL